MKINVTFIYYCLLSVSFASSCLLFILVASDGIQSVDDEKQEHYENISEKNSLDVEESGLRLDDVNDTDGSQLHSSFNEVNKLESGSQNIGLSNGFSDNEQTEVFNLADTASSELEQRINDASSVRGEQHSTVENNKTEQIDIPEIKVSNYIIRAEPKLIGKESENELNKTEYNNKQENKIEIVEEEQSKEQQQQQDEVVLPSFSEWTQKQLEEEAEKKKDQVNISAHVGGTMKKIRSKNYASPDCGAKIVAANPEAVSPYAVLSQTRDEYKLNACTNRIWFVVELCEAIQAKQIDLANFELFSSSPKDFAVSISDRFPTRDWSSVGHFQAKDERDVQSFNLNPHLFGKFIKVEMLSHWGSEHFCPISLFRVYGTSEFEVLATEDSIHQQQQPNDNGLINNNEDEDDDDINDVDDESLGGEATNNLFGSARDAVISIVKKAAEALVKSGDTSETNTLKNGTNSNSSTSNNIISTPLMKSCSIPSHLIVCNNCSDRLYGDVYELLSCHNYYLTQLMNSAVLVKSLYNTDVCLPYGLDFYYKSLDQTSTLTQRYISLFLTPKYKSALCNILAVYERKVVLNTTNATANQSIPVFGDVNNTFLENLTNLEQINSSEMNSTSCPPDGDGDDNNDNNNGTMNLKTEVKTGENSDEKTITDTTLTSQIVTSQESITDDDLLLQIQPTQAFSKESDSISTSSSSSSSISDINSSSTLNLDPSETTTTLPSSIVNEAIEESSTASKQSDDSILDNVLVQQPDSSEHFEIVHDQFDKFLSELNLDPVTTTVTPTNNVPQQQVQKESVFLRLSNRIKALERNMSLSGQYLEELSRRYKKQVEDMQRAFEKKLLEITEENKRREEFELRLQHQIDKLTKTVEMLLTERDNFWSITSLLSHFIFVEIFVATVILYFYCFKSSTSVLKQRQQTVTNIKVKRRKSIDTVHHETFVMPPDRKKRRPSEETLRINGTYKELLIDDKNERRKRKKKYSNNGLNSLVSVRNDDSSTTVGTKQEPVRKISPLLIQNGNLSAPIKIEEIPIALEPSEHSALDTETYFNHNFNPALINNVSSSTKNGTVKSSQFFHTALSSRSKRTKKLQLFRSTSLRKSLESSPEIFDDQTSVNSSDSSKKEKKSGFKKIFQKVFD